MSQVFDHDKAVLVGFVPLLAVNTLSLSEGYKLPAIGRGDRSQWLGRTEFTVSIQGLLIGPDRFQQKAALETMADLSVLLPSLSSIPGLGGIFIVSDLTILSDMQITSLSFTQTNQEFGAISVNISLKHCPRGLLGGLLGRGLNLASSLGGTGTITGGGTRSATEPLG